MAALRCPCPSCGNVYGLMMMIMMTKVPLTKLTPKGSEQRSSHHLHNVKDMMIGISMMIFMGYLIIHTATENSMYTTKYDGIDLDEVLANDRLLTKYIDCLLDQGHCTPDGNELKKNLPDAIENECKKCTERQREGADQVMHYIIDNRPEDWAKLEEKYDTDGNYKMKYLANKLAAERKANTTTNISSEDSKSTSKEQ